MNRHERRARAAQLRRHTSKLPADLTAVPQEQWPPNRYGSTQSIRVGVFQSNRYLVQVFQELPMEIGGERIGVRRITVNRVEVEKNLDWKDDIRWDDLQDIKRDLGMADNYAVEVYPADFDVVNVANMRHLWVLDRPLPLGWVKQVGVDGQA